ncbi:MAG: barstar family protein [Lachnospiraceae bacterium]|nr:barstar family protein [Lachnospiraceae bacterium]
MKRVIIIDGRKFSDLEGFYNLMDKTLRDDDEEIMGHNLDAFNDLLGGGFGVHDIGEPIIIKWINYGESRKALGYEETERYYRRKLEKTQFTDNYVLRRRMELAAEHKGRTLLDMITSIILNDETGHDCELIIEE